MLKNYDRTLQVKVIKKKKRKDSGIATDVVKQTEADDNSSAPKSRKMKKKAKEKPVSTEASDSNCPSCPDEQERSEKSAKRKKKKKGRTGCSSITGDVPCQGEGNSDTDRGLRNRNPDGSETHESTSGGSKKKKSKLKPNETLAVVSAKDQSHTPNVSGESKRKIHAGKRHSGHAETSPNVKKKRRDKSRNEVEEEGGAKGNRESVEEAADISSDRDEMVKKKKKKKKRKHSRSGEIKSDSEEHFSTDKPKRERAKVPSKETETRSSKCKGMNVREPKGEQELNVLNPGVGVTDERCSKKKKKKQKLRCEAQESEGEREALSEASLPESKRQTAGQINGDKQGAKSKRKRCKTSAAAKEEGLRAPHSQPVELLNTAPGLAEIKKETIPRPKWAVTEGPAKTKRKRKQTATVRKIKVEIESQESDGDLQITSEKKGNVFEATIDKARRQALQAEVDRVSGKTNTSETGAMSGTKLLNIKPLIVKPPDVKPHNVKPQGTQFGQWNTAAFQNPDQQNKFLRLMGGFKKSNQHLLTGVDSEKPNMALNKSDEQKLHTHLQSEFDKALNFRQNRGSGLGFHSQQPHIKSKTFFIDKYASTSAKFN